MTIIEDRFAANEITCPSWCEPAARGCEGDHWRHADYWRIDRAGEACPVNDPRYGPIMDGKCCSCREREMQPEILVGVGLSQHYADSP